MVSNKTPSARCPVLVNKGNAGSGLRTQAARPGAFRASGFTYIGLLIFISLMGVALAGTGVVFHRQAQREKEKELLFVGDQFRRAIGEYYQRSPGGDKRFPRALEDLLLDQRYPATQRYLRRVYRDPMTGGKEWGLVRRDDNSIAGVYSLADGEPAKQANFPAAYEGFKGKTRYADWAFVYQAPAAPETRPRDETAEVR